jgi:hypothetical protein
MGWGRFHTTAHYRCRREALTRILGLDPDNDADVMRGAEVIATLAKGLTLHSLDVKPDK